MRVRSAWVIAAVALSLYGSHAAGAQTTVGERNVIVVMTDGLRWQEVFHGADESLLTAKNYFDGRSVAKLQQGLLAPTAEERRARLMPFLWGTMVAQGELYGDPDVGSDAHVANGLNFSYPGYSETLTGHPDARIKSNDNLPNPNVTVFEWLNKQPGMQGRVAAFGAWEVFSGIFNAGRCGFPVNASYEPFTLLPGDAVVATLNRQKAEVPRVWDDEVFDAPEFETALEYLKVRKPRLLFVSLGETDDWAHGGNYGEYLNSAQRADADLARVWSAVQAMPEYKGKTTLVFLTDHGRGSGAESWKDHGTKVPESKNIFIAMMGSGVPAVGLVKGGEVTQGQVAATVAKLLGYDWNGAEPLAAAPLPGVR